MQRLFDYVAGLPSRLRRRTSSGSYRPEIDGLRFLAIAIVVAGHLAERVERFRPSGAGALVHFVAHPQGGVFLFFTVSGFIIVSQFQRIQGAFLTGEHLKTYFQRRALRIEPPYLLLLLATYAVIELFHVVPPGLVRFDAEPRSLTTSLVASLLYSHGWLFGSLPRLFPPGWTLEVEIQFYILAPFLFWAYFTAAASRGIGLGLAVLAFSVFVAMTAPMFWAPEHSRLTVLAHFPFFWLGALMAVHRQALVGGLSRLRAAAGAAMGWAGLLAFVVVGAWLTPGLGVDFARMVIQIVSIGLMFAGVVHPANSFRAFCSRPWISFLGGACYSIYLTHLQVLQFVGVVLAKAAPAVDPVVALALMTLIGLPLVVITGLVFYAYVERFFMRPDWPRLVFGGLRRVRGVGAPR